MDKLFLKAKELIDNASYIALSTHENPDLDGLGSLLALDFALRDMGKETLAFSAGALAENLKFLPHKKIVYDVDPKKVDLLIGLDYGSPERLEILKAYPELQSSVLTFDHHAVGRHLGLKIVDGNISSTSELIYNFLNSIGQAISPSAAYCLLAGIMSDTGGFRHINTSAQTLKIAGELMLKGASLQKISQAVNNLENIDEKLLGLTGIFKKIQTVSRVNLIFIVIEHQLFLTSSAGLKEVDVASLLSATPEAKIAATITEKVPGHFDVSLRSQQDKGINVAQLAQSFGGGGHRLAAGFRSSDPAEIIVAKIEQLLLATPELND
ncbi:MAG TPA: DHH family phosphoesterase [Candidatus Portnoybacteria bacterium]|nr:DHH family phosphoesterase [Candidatus Portnoybacteria bacterium]